MRFAPATNCPSPSASSAITGPSKPTGPSEPGSAPNAARISSSVAGRHRLARGPRQLGELEPVVTTHEREHDSPVLERHRHRLRGRREVDLEEARRAPRSVVDTRRLHLDRGLEHGGGNVAGAAARARPRGRRRSRRLCSVRVCSRPSQTARGSQPTRFRPSSPTRPGPRSTRARSARRSCGRRASCARKLRSRPSSSRSKE